MFFKKYILNLNIEPQAVLISLSYSNKKKFFILKHKTYSFDNLIYNQLFFNVTALCQCINEFIKSCNIKVNDINICIDNLTYYEMILEQEEKDKNINIFNNNILKEPYIIIKDYIINLNNKDYIYRVGIKSGLFMQLHIISSILQCSMASITTKIALYSKLLKDLNKEIYIDNSDIYNISNLKLDLEKLVYKILKLQDIKIEVLDNNIEIIDNSFFMTSLGFSIIGSH